MVKGYGYSPENTGTGAQVKRLLSAECGSVITPDTPLHNVPGLGGAVHEQDCAWFEV
jgi:hypothetical protein